MLMGYYDGTTCYVYVSQVKSETTTHSLGQVARALGRVQDLVVEHGEVEGQPQADGVRGRQVLVCQV